VTYTIDSRSAANIATLLPEVRPIAERFLTLANDGRLGSGVVVKIISGTRTYEEQTALYAHGRSASGVIVTDAPAGYSLHNFGIAFDIGIFQNGRYLDDSPLYRQLGPVGKGLGLQWGGDWQSITDEPHYQFNPHNFGLAALRQLHATGQNPVA